jgi:hypothetical protein
VKNTQSGGVIFGENDALTKVDFCSKIVSVSYLGATRLPSQQDIQKTQVRFVDIDQ